MKKIFFGAFFILTLFNVIKYEIYMLLNPSVLKEQTSENKPVSTVDSKISVCKAKGTNPLKEIGKILRSIDIAPVLSFNVGLDNNIEIAINQFPLDLNPDSRQLNIHLRI